MKIDNFFEEIRSIGAISLIWKNVLEMLKGLQPDISDDALAVFCIYFSLLDDGNTCIPLDSAKLSEIWKKKWVGLRWLIQSAQDNEQDDETELSDEALNQEFKQKFLPPITEGIKEIKSKKLTKLIGTKDQKLLFVIEDSTDTLLFAKKYFNAKEKIENKIGKIFDCEKTKISEAELSKIRDYFYHCTMNAKTGKPIKLESEQCEAILRGLNENMIITGGPGTGKTTVVCFLLWKLFQKNPELLNYTLYLAAPSGKAADRLKESILNTLGTITESEREKNEVNKKIFKNLRGFKA